MKFELKEIQQLTGQRCKIYSVLMEGDENTLFEQFTDETKYVFPDEIENIIENLKAIARRVGAREQFFRPKKEGKLGDGVEALFDYPNAHLRLYAIKYADGLLILGGGGQNLKILKLFKKTLN